MDKDKSILEKFTETMKGLADSASEALKSEEPPKTSAPAGAYMPLAVGPALGVLAMWRLSRDARLSSPRV